MALFITLYIQEKFKILKLYIVTHKDFPNKVLVNPAYKILCDEKSQLKQVYKLEIIETSKNNILYPKKIGYAEGSKIYPIWKSYKEGRLSSKYIGLFHYRRIFAFKNDIPELDKIFNDYDAILPKKWYFSENTREQYKRYHLVQFLDFSVEIIKEKYPEYYPYAQRFLKKKWISAFNIFIMKKKDFIKWGEFIFGVLLEFDRRLNLTSDADIKKFLINERIKTHQMFDIKYQSRLEAFIMERISNVFYDKYFHKRYEIDVVNIS